MSTAESDDALLLAALRHYRARDFDRAACLCQNVLAGQPDHLPSLMLLGMVRADEGDADAAEALFRRCLALSPDAPRLLHYLGKLRQRAGDIEAAGELFARAAAQDPDFAPTLNDLGVCLERLGRLEEALAAFDRALAAEPTYTTAQCNRALVLRALKQPDAAAAAFAQVLTVVPRSPDEWHNLAIACYHTDALDRAEAACRQVLALDPAHQGARLQLAHVLERAHRLDEAAQESAAWAKRQGVAVSPCTGHRAEARVLLVGAAARCNVPTDVLFEDRRFDKISVYVLARAHAEDDPAALAARLPDIDIVFNTIGDPDRGAAFLDEAAALCRQLDRPILNAPDRIAWTSRERVAARLSGIAGLVVPETKRVHRDELATLSEEPGPFHRPMLVRPVGSHGGIGLMRLDRRSDCAEYLARTPGDHHYLTDYWDYRSADGCFRKYRLIFVDREVYPYHLAISDEWLVHYWRTDMRGMARMMREEADFLADYESVFHGARGAAVREVARRLDLDYAGLDCAVLADGRVLLFEANAGMQVHLNVSRDAFADKHEYVPRIGEAVSRMVARRLAADNAR